MTLQNDGYVRRNVDKTIKFQQWYLTICFQPHFLIDLEPTDLFQQVRAHENAHIQNDRS